MYDPTFGLINGFFNAVGLERLALNWLGDSNIAFYSASAPIQWRFIPLYMIIFMAGISNIPKQLYEAAEIDGANAWQKFFYITLPNLKYPSMIVIVLHVLWTFNNFDFIYLSTGGGPVGSTEVLATQIYQTAWNYYEYGKASAMGILMMLIMMIFSIYYIRKVRSGE